MSGIAQLVGQMTGQRALPSDPIGHLVAQTMNLTLLESKRQALRRPRVMGERATHFVPQILRMRDEGLTYREIGECLGMTPSAAANFISRYRVLQAEAQARESDKEKDK